MERKPLALYVGITYAISFLAQALLLSFHMLPLTSANPRAYALFFVLAVAPAGGALLASSLTGDTKDPALKLWPVPWHSALKLTGMVVAAFILSFALAAVAGWTKVDWNLSNLVSTLPRPSEIGLDSPVPVAFLIALGLAVSVVLGLTVFAVIAAGSEIGWRGYCLAKYLPQGRVKAYAITGALQGLTFTPIILYLNGIGFIGWFRLLQICLLTIAIGAFLGEVWRRSNGHLGLTSVCCGAVLGQVEGVWGYLAPGSHPLAGGPFGFAAVIVWLVVAVVACRWPEQNTPAVAENRVATSDSN